MARIGLDDLSGRFEAFVVHERSDLAACVEIIESVRRWELRRVAGRTALETSGFSEEGADAIMLAVRERWSGRIVGCVRGIFARSVAHQPQVHHEYRLDLVPPELIEYTGIAARMAIMPQMRKTGASLVLTRAFFEHSIRDCGMMLFCVSCEPALLSMYQRMGYRAVGRAWAKPSGGYRVPTLLVGHDEEHLARVRSPLLPALRRLPRPWPDAGLRWFRAQPDLPAESGVRRWEPRYDHRALSVLTAGLSAAGRRGLLEHAVEVEGQPGDLAFREGDGVRGLAVVLEGEVSALRGDRAVARLGAGEVIGVASAVLGQARQASIVVERPGTRLLLLSRSAIERVRGANDRTALWQTLAQILAWRAVHERPCVEPVPEVFHDSDSAA
ncbi:cyclic nucleotide-binding domain-containing protein [Paraliomyxa miuraensis]|uniref:cyclic nucleotide-binding domain-containing protein n=1 Tax=Paraliomyxa miuraensis TaxID=376150 RepID=UPI002258A085|nr:cyclic nucleotide-binding domain-containing protein [Paraliomyxa miuraensis]MCX4241829.1 cyclic nucleotide-binding domain-containing protein [Paraliomyxa miuraensis]